MLRVLMLGLLLGAGCQNVQGPLKYRQPVRVDDPNLTISEQERLGRDRIGLPDDSITDGPRDYLYRPFGPGR